VFTKPSSQTCLQSDASRTFPSFEPRKFPTSTQIQIHLRRRRKRVSHTLRTRRLSLRCTPNSPRDREDPLLRYRRQVPLQIRSLTRLTLARRPSHHVPAPEHRQFILQRAAAQSSTCRPPTLNRLRRTTTFRQSDGLLGQAAFEITVAPASKVFDITYYDYHRVSVLLTGSRVLIALPSCIFNLSLLPYQYSSLASSQTGNIFSSTYTSFSHGIAIVQNAGETLTTPLFWCFIAFYTSISVAAEYPVATAAKYTAARTHGLVPRDNTHVAR
jgi:hypothetical protein